jgi:hypothetical protein
MHFHCEIYLKEKPAIREELETKIEEIMAPFQEAYIEETDSHAGFWDWWQVGGRWSGIHTDYDPDEDPRNIDTCSLCNGTGLRNDTLGKKARKKDPSYTCNGCSGKGKRPLWPSLRVPYEGDIMSVNDIRPDLDCYTLIVSGVVYHTDKWTGKEFIKTEFDGNVSKQLNKLGLSNGYLVTVDYHC